ncbi:putative ribonuclease H-like domain-containing protein [Tanacetum coccineum]
MLWKKGKLAPRFVGPFEIIEKKCLVDQTLQVPLDEIQVNDKLNFVEEPVEILEKEFKKLKQSRIAIVKVRWNSKRRLEFMWEHEDQMKLKYPHLFSADNVRCASFEALYGRKCHSPIMEAEVGEGQLIRPELVQETTDKISKIKDRLKAARDHQKSYADKRRKPLEFSVGDYVLLKVSHWKGVVRFEKKRKLAPRFVGPFEIIEKVGPVAYRLDLLEELNGVHDMFHVSNLKKCLADPTLQVPLDEIQVDAKLNFVEEPVEILKREIKKVKRSRIAIVKVQWNLKRRLEFTWEHEDQMKLKYPHLFSADKYVVPTSKVVVPTSRYVVPAGKVIIIVSPGRLSLVPTGRVLSPGSDNESDDASFPYLKKDEYEVWAMKMEYWITNNDMNIWKVIQKGNNLKRTRRDHDRRFIILPPTTADEHITVQRESKARTTLLQSIPDDHVADFHYMDDASRGIAQRVALTLKTKGGLELLSFDDLYYKLKTLETRSHRSGNVIEDVLQSFVADTKPEQQLAYKDFDQIEKIDLEEMDLKWQMAMLSIRVHKFEEKARRKIDYDKKESARFNKKKVKCYQCLQRGHFARECRAKGGNDKQRYSSFKIQEIGKKEEDSKALVTVDTLVDWTEHDGQSDGVIAPKEFGMIAGCDTKDAIEQGATKIYNLITGADTMEASTVGDAGEFALMGVTSEVHNCPFGCDNKYNELQKKHNELNEQNSEYFIQVQAYKNSLKTLEKQKRVLQKNQLTLEDKIRVLSIELEKITNLLKHSKRINAIAETAKKELQTKLDNHLVQIEKWRTSTKNFVFTTNSKEVEGRPLFKRFAKADSMKAVPPPLSGDYTPLSDHIDLDESQVSYCIKSSTSGDSNSVSNDFVSCDNSDKSSEVNTNDFASSDSNVKSSKPKSNDSTSCASTSSVSTSESEAEIESNVGTPIQEPIIVHNLPSFSCNSSDKNENTSRTSCNKNGYFNKKAGHFRKNASSVSKLCFVCGSSTHLIKDCDFYEKQMANKTVGNGVGPVHSRNNVNHQNQFVPQVVLLRTGKVNIPPASPQPVPTGRP